ncbi:BnaC09g20110D [Brassica napus]|uniref:BnaC09g20110D protein n=1 Tax=Brassica napus TaxID=3708 RepID=A0A078GKT2_BRANA|nr:BnaC09g20110D [Brassica napus]
MMLAQSRGSSLESDSPNLTKYRPKPSKGEINTTKKSSSSNHFIRLKLCKVSNNHFVMLPYLQSSAPPKKLKVQGQYRQVFPTQRANLKFKAIFINFCLIFTLIKKIGIVQEGFDHHAEKGYLVLEGLVLNQYKEVLVVQEKHLYFVEYRTMEITNGIF